MNEPWPAERVERLITLWNLGHSASRIARALGGGVTRNAVIGKLNRLKLAPRPGPTTPSQYMGDGP